jgi:hypothetical protein
LPRGCKRRVVPRASLPGVSVPGRHGRVHVRPQPSSEWRRHGPKDHHSRHRATRLAASGGGRAVCGYATIGLPFRSGHILSLSRFPASSAGSLRAVSSAERPSPRGAERPSPAETGHKRTAYARREIGIGPTASSSLACKASHRRGTLRETCWRLVWPPPAAAARICSRRPGPACAATPGSAVPAPQ